MRLSHGLSNTRTLFISSHKTFKIRKKFASETRHLNIDKCAKWDFNFKRQMIANCVLFTLRLFVQWRVKITSFITGRNEVVAKVMFLHVCVILFTGGVLPARSGGGLRAGAPSRPGRENPPPPADLAGRTPPPPTWQGEKKPRPGRPPPPDLAGRTPPPRTRQTPPGPGRENPPSPGPGRPPPREEDCSIRSMSGRYASYWNAFLFVFLSDDASTSEYTKELVPEMDF